MLGGVDVKLASHTILLVLVVVKDLPFIHPMAQESPYLYDWLHTKSSSSSVNTVDGATQNSSEIKGEMFDVLYYNGVCYI